MLDIVMKVVCTRVGNYWCKVGLETSQGLPHYPADILAAASKLATQASVKTQKTDKPGMLSCNQLPQNKSEVIPSENESYRTGH